MSGDVRQFPKRPGLRILTPAEWGIEPPPVRRWIIDGVVPVGAVTMLSGDGGIGKSLLALQAMASTATGKHWIGIPTHQCDVFGLFAEDEEGELHRRLCDIARDLGVSLQGLAGLSVLSRVGEDNLLMQFGRDDAGRVTPFYTELVMAIRDVGARFVVLDSLHDLFGGNENSRTQARQFVQCLRKIALDIKGAVFISAHPSMTGLSSGTGSSGSTAWNNAVRSRLYLERRAGSDNPDERIVRTMKSNYAALGTEIVVRWRDGVFVADVEHGITRHLRERSAESAFLTCLDVVAKRGQAVSDALNSPRFAPRMFAKMAEGKPHTVTDLRRAMDQLFADGRIKTDLVIGPNRHPIKTISAALSALSGGVK